MKEYIEILYKNGETEKAKERLEECLPKYLGRYEKHEGIIKQHGGKLIIEVDDEKCRLTTDFSPELLRLIESEG